MGVLMDRRDVGGGDGTPRRPPHDFSMMASLMEYEYGLLPREVDRDW